MVHTFWSVKGGSGVTVCAAVVAAINARQRSGVVLVDLCGDQPAALGLPEPHGAGLTDWLAAEDSTAEALDRLLIQVTDGLMLLPRGAAPRWPRRREADLVEALRAMGSVVVDAGVLRGRANDAAAHDGDDAASLVGLGRTLAPSGRSTLVIRSCYLAIRRAMQLRPVADDLVVVLDEDRCLDARDVGNVLDLRVAASVDADPAVARSIDSGQLLRRRPRSVERALQAATWGEP